MSVRLLGFPLRPPLTPYIALLCILATACQDSPALTCGPGTVQLADQCVLTNAGDEADADADSYTVESGDCADSNPLRYPGAVEVCNGLDDDCDGVVDDDAEDGTIWFADADEDGYGDPANAQLVCDEPVGHVTNANDCDDGDGASSPAGVEVCADGVDNDCDGLDASCSGGSLSSANAKYTGRADNDHAGKSVSGAGDVNQDGFDDLIIGATGADASYLILGSAVPSRSEIDAADAKYVGDAALYYVGTSVSSAGDVNGDGFGDVLVGAPDAGAFLILGSASPSDRALAAADAVYTEGAERQWAGNSVSSAGDVNGDGFGDVLVGAPYNDEGGTYAGAAYMILGGPAPVSLDLSAADAKFTGGENERAGWSVSGAGDVDGDGLDDVAIGAPYGNATYLVLGSPTPGSRDSSAADATYTCGGYLGLSVSEAGDVNADGFADLVMGAPGGAGAAYLILGSVAPVDTKLRAADAQFTGEANNDDAGGSVSGAGDVNADGFADLLVGATWNGDGGYAAGAAYLVLGSAVPSNRDPSLADAQFTGESGSDFAGVSVSAAGDVDADGFDDLLVGAVYNDEGGSDAGAAYLILGPGF